MIALFSLLVIVLLSIVVVRIGAIALELTGLSPEISSFQAQSAFSGVGFTTQESETLVTHPVRRRIIRILILLGSAGVTTSMATLVLTFVGSGPGDIFLKGAVLLIGLVLIFLFARSPYIYKIMKRVISGALIKWTTLRVFDYEQLLGFNEGYSISRITVRKDSWLADKRLNELHLHQNNVLVLAIYRRVNGKEVFIGGPTGETEIKPQDVLICYSRHDISKALADKCKGCTTP